MFGKQNNKNENILILGLGGVGLYLAKRLIDDEHAVTIIESNPQLIAFAEGQIDARLIQGDAMSIRCWKNAGIDQMDYMIAVTDNDAVNMMAARIAHRNADKRVTAGRSPGSPVLQNRGLAAPSRPEATSGIELQA